MYGIKEASDELDIQLSRFEELAASGYVPTAEDIENIQIVRQRFQAICDQIKSRTG